ncbi:DUF6919 domain-containing protein [Actinocrinis sp.]|uniref:DUF6919 domain-containing protein n=1 Tax=Actinocrinis sp. TaxID=1920516 RepID=UPI002D2CE77B|nr:hypothetical protein [Actinocrinis sp.]HZP54613.1 hypothetical protein [Actinocrinis sp.]
MTATLPAWITGALDGTVVRTEDRDRPLTPAERAQYRADAATWYQAASLRSLGLLTADWLEGRNLYLPAYGATCPDPETRDLIPTLAAANRAGYVTDCSQPGHAPTLGYNGRLWRQLAAVSGYCDERTAASLHEAFAPRAVEHGLYVYIWAPGRKPRRTRGQYEIPATIHADPHDPGDQWLSTVFGPPLSCREVRSIYRGALSRPAVKALAGAWQVTLADTEYGRNDRLWPLLAEWAAGEAA